MACSKQVCKWDEPGRTNTTNPKSHCHLSGRSTMVPAVSLSYRKASAHRQTSYRNSVIALSRWRGARSQKIASYAAVPDELVRSLPEWIFDVKWSAIGDEFDRYSCDRAYTGEDVVLSCTPRCN